MTGSSAAAPGDASGGTAFGRTATIGMPVVTLDFTMMAPPKMDCSATGPPSTWAEVDRVGEHAGADLDGEPPGDLLALGRGGNQHGRR